MFLFKRLVRLKQRLDDDRDEFNRAASAACDARYAAMNKAHSEWKARNPENRAFHIDAPAEDPTSLEPQRQRADRQEAEREEAEREASAQRDQAEQNLLNSQQQSIWFSPGS